MVPPPDPPSDDDPPDGRPGPDRHSPEPGDRDRRNAGTDPGRGERDPPWDDQEGTGAGTPSGDPDRTSDEADPGPVEDPLRWLGTRLLAVGAGVVLSVGGFAVALVLFLVYQVALAVALVGFGVEIDGPLVTLLAGYVILQGIAFPTIAAVYLGFRWGLSKVLDTEFPRNFVRIGLPSVWDVGWTVLGYVGVFVLVTGSLFVVSLLDAPTAERSNQQVFQNPEALLLMIPISFLLIGPGEELLFRGIIQDRLRESFSAPSAILLASAMFAPLHILALSGGLQALLTTVAVLFVPSLVFGVTYELSDNLAVPIVIHGAYDATIFGLSYLSLVAGLPVGIG